MHAHAALLQDPLGILLQDGLEGPQELRPPLVEVDLGPVDRQVGIVAFHLRLQQLRQRACDFHTRRAAAHDAERERAVGDQRRIPVRGLE